MRTIFRYLALASMILISAAKPRPSTKDKRAQERELTEMAELAESVGQTDKAISILDELRALCRTKGAQCETKDGEILEQLGWLCLKSKACADRRKSLLEEIARAIPSKTGLIHDLKEALGGKDEEEGEEKEPDNSIPALREHLKTHPDDLDARSDLADLLLEAGEKLEAIKHLEIYLVSRPSDLEARMNLIDALRDSGRRGRALEEIAQMLSRKRDAWKLRELQIELLFEEKRNEEIDRALDALERDAPGRAMTWVLAAERRMEKDDPSEASALLLRAKTISSTEAETVQRIVELERDIAQMRKDSSADFVREVHQYDLEDDLRYGTEIQ
jgi:tetratricopeptide (TPR) repeat protein